MAKITAQRAFELLKLLGANVEPAEDENGEEYIEEDIIRSIDNKRVDVIKPKIWDEIHKEVAGRQGGTLRTHLVKTTGISRKVLDEIANDEEAIRQALAFREEKYSADSKTMRDQLDGIAQQHQEREDSIKTEYEQKLQEAHQRYISRDILDGIASRLDSKNLPEGSDKRRVAEILRAELSKEIDLGYDEADKKILAYTKGTQNPALNKAKTNSFDWDEAIDGVLTPLGLLRKDMRDVHPNGERGGGVDLRAARRTAPENGGGVKSYVEQMKNIISEQVKQ